MGYGLGSSGLRRVSIAPGCFMFGAARASGFVAVGVVHLRGRAPVPNFDYEA